MPDPVLPPPMGDHHDGHGGFRFPFFPIIRPTVYTVPTTNICQAQAEAMKNKLVADVIAAPATQQGISDLKAAAANIVTTAASCNSFTGNVVPTVFPTRTVVY